MNSEELVRLIDSIHRDKGIDKETLFDGIEQALISAARKHFGEDRTDVTVRVDRETGGISAYEGEDEIDPVVFGRIAARTAYQVMTQRFREAERDVVFDDYENKVGSLVTGTVQRFERGTMIINLGKTEGIIPRQEQVFNETYRPGDRIRGLVVEVKKKGQKVVIVLSRTDIRLVNELFKLEVPEISDRIVEIKHTVREPGHRTKIAMSSRDLRVDPIGACVGIRGTRIRSIVDEINGEKIDIVRWSDSDEQYIRNALSPAEITAVELEKATRHARVIVAEDQLSLAIGRKGQNVRLSAKITDWHIDILSEEEAKREREEARLEMRKLTEVIDGLEDAAVDNLMLAGFPSLGVVVRKGVEALSQLAAITEEQAAAIFEYAEIRLGELKIERAVRAEAEAKAKAEARAAEAAARAAEAETEATPGAGDGDPVAPADGTEAAEAAEADSAGEDEAEDAEATPEAGDGEPGAAASDTGAAETDSAAEGGPEPAGDAPEETEETGEDEKPAGDAGEGEK